MKRTEHARGPASPRMGFRLRPALRRVTPLLPLLCLLRAVSLIAQEAGAPTRFGPYFLGYETEPAMEYGGRVISALDAGIADPVFAWLGPVRGAAAAVEFPLAIVLSTVQHEVLGHGGRAREYGLDPGYGIGFDFSAYTTLNKAPRSVEQILVMTGGGTEADGILADRILRDLCRPDGAPAALVPLMFAAKTDLTLYSLVTSDPAGNPDPDADTSFAKEYAEGNDIALYVAARQAQSKGGIPPASVWERTYRIDFADPRLHDNWRDVRDAGTWNIVDPMMWTAMFLYVRDHLIRGQRFISTPGLGVADGVAVNLGTRAAIGPQSVSRFLDLYCIAPKGTVRLYGRELAGSSDTRYGFGGGLYGIRLASGLRASLSADQWDEPAAPENLYEGTSWNACAELAKEAGDAWGLTVKAGYKTDGFLPGTPMDAGLYWGGGVEFSF